MTPERRDAALWIALWAAPLAAALAFRPPLPVDETRYLAVAWEMWNGGDFLVPHLNGEIYAEKPPLLFWLIDLGWAAFGVNEWWPRLVAPLFALGNLFLTARLGQSLWPGTPAVAATAPVALAAAAAWSLFATLTMFDMMVAFFALVGLVGVVEAARGRPAAGFAGLALGLGLGLLAKGPAILVPVLPAALMAPLWARRLADAPAPIAWRRWYAGIFLAVLGGGAIALLWAVPAAVAGGPVYRETIFWRQTASRVVQAIDHARPWWWYGPVLPLALLPLAAWPPAWRAFARLRNMSGDGGVRFCLAWALPAFLLFTAFSGKQLHYLLPIFPALALLTAFLLAADAGAERPVGSRRSRLDRALPGFLVALIGVVVLASSVAPIPAGIGAWAHGFDHAWGVGLVAAGVAAAAIPIEDVKTRLAALAGLACVSVIAFHLIARPVLAGAFDLRGIAARLGTWEREGVPLAHNGTYHGQFHFLGRLGKPIAVIGDQEVMEWVRNHPNGRIITYQRGSAEGAQPIADQPFRTSLRIRVWDSAQIRDAPRLFRRP